MSPVQHVLLHANGHLKLVVWELKGRQGQEPPSSMLRVAPWSRSGGSVLFLQMEYTIGNLASVCIVNNQKDACYLSNVLCRAPFHHAQHVLLHAKRHMKQAWELDARLGQWQRAASMLQGAPWSQSGECADCLRMDRTISNLVDACTVINQREACYLSLVVCKTLGKAMTALEGVGARSCLPSAPSVDEVKLVFL